jgi:hypothetical protein
MHSFVQNVWLSNPKGKVRCNRFLHTISDTLVTVRTRLCEQAEKSSPSLPPPFEDRHGTELARLCSASILTSRA